MANLFAIHDAYHLVFPGLLLVFYVVCWLALGRDPETGNIAPRYEPPAGIFAGVARYILTRGTDGTPPATGLTRMAAQRVGLIPTHAWSYSATPLNSCT